MSDSWYLPTEDPHARLYVYELGDPAAPPIVVLHGGWGAEYSYLKPAVSAFAGSKYRFVFYDQRGSLRSPTENLQSLSVDQQVADLDRLRQALGLNRMVLLGHSMGTFLAMSYAKAHPEHVAGLILTGAMPAATPVGGAEAYWKANKPYTDALQARPEVAAELAKIPGDVKTMNPKDATHVWRIKFASVNVYKISRWRQMEGGQVFYAQKAGSTIAATMPDAWNFEPALTTDHLKVQVIDGDHDYADPDQAYWRGFVSRHPEDRLTILKDAAHSSWIDDPQEFQTSLAGALSWMVEPPRPRRP